MFDKVLPRILIIENKENINISLYNIIERAGFDIIKANTLEQALSRDISPAIIIIGMQPEQPKTIIATIREVEKLSQIPIIFLSAPEKTILDQPKMDHLHNVELNSERFKQDEFEEQASSQTSAYAMVYEDASLDLAYKLPSEANYASGRVNNLISFLLKSFSSDQLINTIKNLLRHAKPVLQDNIVKFKNINIDLNTQRLYKNGKIIRTSPTEFKILHLFLQFPTTIFSRQQIMEHLWEDNKNFSSRIIDVHISRIRETLRDINEKEEFIKTVRFFGYCLELPDSSNKKIY